MQHISHTHGRGIRQQDKAQVGRGLVVVQAVLGRTVGDEGVVLAAQLAHHIPQAEDGAEDKLGVVLGTGRRLAATDGVGGGGCGGGLPIRGGRGSGAGVGDG